MPWIHHPRFRPIRDDLIDALSSNLNFFKKLPPIIFLCGAGMSTRRDHLAQYLRKHTYARVFYAEDVWERLLKLNRDAKNQPNALQLEAELATFADMVIILVESAGTIAELGAFSIHEKLRQKLFAILESEYQGDPSFINTGPVSWIDADSVFKPSIYTNLDLLLRSASDISERISRIKKPVGRRITKLDISTDKKLFLFFVIDLVAVAGPISAPQIEYFVRAITGIPDGLDLSSTIELSCSIGVLKAVDIRLSTQNSSEDLTRFYYRSSGVRSMFAQPVHGKERPLDLSRKRIRIIEFLQTHEVGATLLKMVWDGSHAAR